MDKKIININEIPKIAKIILALLPLLFIALIPNSLDSDFYFLYPTGEHIVKNGFPTYDFLTIHGDMKIIVQQWLSTVLFYFVYSKLGQLGIYALVIIAYIMMCLVLYKLIYTVTDNHFISCVFATISDLVIVNYETSRPQIFTYILLALELLFLEKHSKTKKPAWLIGVPVISLILINSHCSMWALIFVLMLPYLVGSLPIRFKTYKNEPCCSLTLLIATFIISFGIGFANPYGFDAIKYITSSYGYSVINNLITEMQPVTLSADLSSLLLIAGIVIGAVLISSRLKDFDLRYFLLFAGLSVFSLMNQKSIPYFFIGAIPAIAYTQRNMSFNLSIKQNGKKTNPVLIVLLIIAIAFCGFAGATYLKSDTNPIDTSRSSLTAKLDETINILNNEAENGREIVLYAGFDEGQYLEFNGYKPYIDGRAELFLKDNNKSFNYMNEYALMCAAGIYYKDFIDKYGFNYLIVSQSNIYLQTSLLHDDDYEILYDSNGDEGTRVILFAKK